MGKMFIPFFPPRLCLIFEKIKESKIDIIENTFLIFSIIKEKQKGRNKMLREIVKKC